MKNRLAVVVLSYNGLEDTVKCLTSLDAEAKIQPEIGVLLVDNGSTDGTADEVRKQFPWCGVLSVEKNAGPAAGNNWGIKEVLSKGADWLVLLNNDTTVTSDFLARMSERAENSGGFSILGPVINYMDEPDIVMTDGVEFNPRGFNGFFRRIEVPISTVTPSPIVDVDVVNGCCMMIAASVFSKIGLFDESLFIYHDESDFCIRAIRAGFRCGVFGRQLVWHKGSRSFLTTGKRMQRYYDARNLGVLVRRYGGRLKARRGRVASFAAYLRYTYHRYCVEQESAHAEAALAVIHGLLDAAAGRMGPFEERHHRLAPAVRLAWDYARPRPGR